MSLIVDRKIDRVTVYPDRARVVCSGEATVAPGVQQLLFEELPLTLDPDSVRVSGRGTAQVRLLGVDVQQRHYTETPTAQVRQLEAEVERLQDETAVIKDKKEGWLSQAKYIEGLRQATTEYAKGLAKGRTTVEDQTALVDFLREQDEAMRTAVRRLDIQQRQLNRELHRAQRELKALQSARPRQRFQARVEIEAATEGTFRPELSYVVNKAGWQPLYDLRLMEEKEIEVTYIAQVTQNTGEDWEGVTLTVSTARPALNQRVPELHPWYVDELKPRPPAPVQTRKRAMAPAAASMDMMVGAAPEAAREEEEAAFFDAEPSVAQVQESGTAVSFTVPGDANIPSDGSPHKNNINRFRLDAALDYTAVPKHTDAVFRRAVVTNESAGPLLAGQANLFVGEEFIGRNRIDYTPTAGEMKVILGVEERITVERQLARRDVDKRFLRDNRQLRYGYKITLKNLLDHNVNVEVHDHIPVSRHEQIKVKLEEANPRPAESSKLNLMEWRVALPGGGETTIDYEYTIEHPRSMRVTGLMD